MTHNQKAKRVVSKALNVLESYADMRRESARDEYVDTGDLLELASDLAKSVRALLKHLPSKQ